MTDLKIYYIKSSQVESRLKRFQVRRIEPKNDLTRLWLRSFPTWLAHLCRNLAEYSRVYHRAPGYIRIYHMIQRSTSSCLLLLYFPFPQPVVSNLKVKSKFPTVQVERLNFSNFQFQSLKLIEFDSWNMQLSSFQIFKLNSSIFHLFNFLTSDVQWHPQ